MYMILQKCSIWKVAEIFFIEPTKTHFIKEISKRINLAHTSVKKHVLDLIDLGLIIRSTGEVFPGYKANRENPDFIFYKKISNLVALKESKVIDYLKEKYPKSIVLFGGYSRGEDIETSDIDIFIECKKFKADLKKYEKYLNRNIHLLFKEEVNKNLVGNIAQGIVLFGER